MRTDIENCWSWLRRMIRSNAPRIANPTVRERLYNTYTPLWASKAIGSLAENTRWNSSFSERLGVNEWSSVVWKWHQFRNTIYSICAFSAKQAFAAFSTLATTICAGGLLAASYRFSGTITPLRPADNCSCFDSELDWKPLQHLMNPKP